MLGVQFVVPPSLLAADLQTIVNRGRLVVAVKDNLPPLGFSEAGRLQGFEIDLARRLAEDLFGRSDAVELKPVNNRDRIPSVINGSVDLAIARVTNTVSRARIVHFSLPYYFDGTGLITRSLTLQTEADLSKQTLGSANLRIAVLNGSSTIATLRYKLPHLNLVGVDSYQAARDLLDAGTVDAFAADVSMLTGWAQTASGYRVLPVRLSIEPLCVVLPKGVQYTELQQRVNRAIAQWQSEGWLQKRAIYWGLPWATLK